MGSKQAVSFWIVRIGSKGSGFFVELFGRAEPRSYFQKRRGNREGSAAYATPGGAESQGKKNNTTFRDGGVKARTRNSRLSSREKIQKSDILFKR